MTDTDRYPANVFWSEEDEGFIAVAPDLPGCSAFGATQAEALAPLQDAIAAWIEAARHAGNPVPEPSQPSADPQASGKVLVRMPRSLHAELVQTAKRDNVSLNQFVIYLLTTGHTTHKVVRDLSAALSRSIREVSEPLSVVWPLTALDVSRGNTLIISDEAAMISGVAYSHAASSFPFFDVVSQGGGHGSTVRWTTGEELPERRFFSPRQREDKPSKQIAG